MEPTVVDMLIDRFAEAARAIPSRTSADRAVSAAGKKRKGRKNKGDVFQRCKAQAADLRLLVEISCGDDLACQEPVLTCVGPLETCDFTGFVQCLQDQIDSQSR